MTYRKYLINILLCYLLMIQICSLLVKIYLNWQSPWMKNCKKYHSGYKLSLNIPKTHYMVFSNIRTKVKLDIKIEGNTINQVHSTKFLGIIIDDELPWKSHVKQVSTKVAKGMGIIKAKLYINTTTLMDLYHAFVFPYITYCNIVWGSTFNTHLDQLSILQEQIVRILSNKAYSDHTSELFKRFKNIEIKANQYFPNSTTHV